MGLDAGTNDASPTYEFAVATDATPVWNAAVTELKSTDAAAHRSPDIDARVPAGVGGKEARKLLGEKTEVVDGVDRGTKNATLRIPGARPVRVLLRKDPIAV